MSMVALTQKYVEKIIFIGIAILSVQYSSDLFATTADIKLHIMQDEIYLHTFDVIYKLKMEI